MCRAVCSARLQTRVFFLQALDFFRFFTRLVGQGFVVRDKIPLASNPPAPLIRGVG